MITLFQINKPVSIETLNKYGIQIQKYENDRIIFQKYFNESDFNRVAEKFYWVGHLKEILFVEPGYEVFFTNIENGKSQKNGFTRYLSIGLFSLYMEMILGELGYMVTDEIWIEKCVDKFSSYCCNKCGITANALNLCCAEQIFLESNYTKYLNEYLFAIGDTKMQEILNKYWNEIGKNAFSNFENNFNITFEFKIKES